MKVKKNRLTGLGGFLGRVRSKESFRRWRAMGAIGMIGVILLSAVANTTAGIFEVKAITSTYDEVKSEPDVLERMADLDISYYSPCKGGSGASENKNCGMPSGSEVIWIGDSYSTGSGGAANEEITKALSGVTVYSQGCKTIAATVPTGGGGCGERTTTVDEFGGENVAGTEIAKKLASSGKLKDKYLVLALGTNNPDSGQSGALDTLRQTIAGDLQDAKGIVLVNAKTFDGSTFNEVNNGYQEIAAANANVVVADWAAVAKAEYYQSDKEHPNEGYGAWVKTVTDALGGLGGECSGGAGSCSELASLRKAMWDKASESDKKRFQSILNQEGGGDIAITEAYMNQVVSGHGGDGTLAKWLDYYPSYSGGGNNSNMAEINQEVINKALGGSNTIGFAIGNASYVAGSGVAIAGVLKCVWDSQEQKCVDGIVNKTGGTCNDYVPDTSGRYECYETEGETAWVSEMESKCGGGATARSGSSLVADTDSVSTDGGNSAVSGSNKNYKGDQVWTDEELAKVSENKSFYESAASKYGVPWALLATVHRLETGLARTNGSNGQGAYQFYAQSERDNCKKLNGDADFSVGGTLSDKNFTAQTECVASFLKNNYDGNFNSADGIKRLFFSYNGMAGAYISQARDLGFSEEQAKNGEGSPYVMNRYDEKRDPTVEPTRSNRTWGQIKVDAGGLEYPANSHFGAYLLYEALSGGNLSGGSSSGASGGACCATTGGTTAGAASGDVGALQAKAKEFVWKVSEQAAHSGALDAKEAYKTAWEKNGRRSDVSDCGSYVYNLMLESGWDPDFDQVNEGWAKGSSNGGIGAGLYGNYMEKSSKWVRVDPIPSKKEDWQPGDVFVRSNGSSDHIGVYVGDLGDDYGDGFTDASYTIHSPFANSSTQKTYSGGWLNDYRVYRKSGVKNSDGSKTTITKNAVNTAGGTVADLQAAAQKYAWGKDEKSGKTSEQKEAYKKLWAEHPDWWMNRSTPNWSTHRGNDCAAWVRSVLWASGWDKNTMPHAELTIGMSYYASNGWENVTNEVGMDESKLQPGDVLANSGHVKIYVGKIAGFTDSGIVSADGLAGTAPMADWETVGLGSYSVFRQSGHAMGSITTSNGC